MLLPAVAALSALEVGYFLEFDLTPYLIAAGVLGGLAVLALAAQVLFGGGPRVPADVQQARDELVTNLDTIGRVLQRRLANESTSAGSMAPVEK